MLFLIVIHLWTNYRAVKAVTMVTLNRQRANLVISTFVDAGVVLSPKDVARKERILEWDGVLRWCNGAILGRGFIGTKLSTIVSPPSSSSEKKVASSDVAKACQNEQYMLQVKEGNGTRLEVYICLENGVTPANQLKAWMHGLLSAKGLSDRRVQAERRESEALRAMMDAKRQIDRTFDEFLKRLAEAGWNTGDPQFETVPSYRYERAEIHA
ncbi:hypothetical protein ABW19_dt0200851 [Dactylella cylindrospora]|nr:hypothetical protein ABW19_dt0200851 [Dactylella cylindrospora]